MAENMTQAEQGHIPGIPDHPRIGRRGFLKLAGATVTAGATALAVNKIDQITNAIGSFTRKETPPTFDNKADKGIIGANNEMRVNIEDLQNIPSFDKDNKPILLFPIKNPPADLQISYAKEQGTVFFPPELLAKAQQEGTKDTITLSSVPAGTEVIAPMDARVFTFSVVRDGTTILTHMKVMFKSPDNRLYQLDIGPDFGQQLIDKRMDMSIDASAMTGNLDQWEKGAEVKRGTTIFKTTKSTGILMSMQSWPIPDVNTNTIISTRTPGNMQFATDPTSSKIIVAN